MEIFIIDPSSQATIRFLRDLQTMLGCSGIPLVQVLQTLLHQLDTEIGDTSLTNYRFTENHVNNESLWDQGDKFIAKLQTGQDLFEAMSDFPELFPQHLIGLVRLGENEGILDHQFGLAADAYEMKFLPNESDNELQDFGLIFAQIGMLMRADCKNATLSEAFQLCAQVYQTCPHDTIYNVLKDMSESLQQNNTLSMAVAAQQSRFFTAPVVTLFERLENSHIENYQPFFIDLSWLMAQGLFLGLRDGLDHRDDPLVFQIIQFLESLKFLLQYGSSLAQSLSYIAVHISGDVCDLDFKICLKQLAEANKHGETLAQSMQQLPMFFSPVVCQLIQDAEIHGDMIKTLSAIIEALYRGSFLPG